MHIVTEKSHPNFSTQKKASGSYLKISNFRFCLYYPSETHISTEKNDPSIWILFNSQACLLMLSVQMCHHFYSKENAMCLLTRSPKIKMAVMKKLDISISNCRGELYKWVLTRQMENLTREVVRQLLPHKKHLHFSVARAHTHTHTQTFITITARISNHHPAKCEEFYFAVINKHFIDLFVFFIFFFIFFLIFFFIFLYSIKLMLVINCGRSYFSPDAQHWP